MKVTICHPGTQYSHYLAVQLNNSGYLLKFHTGIAFGHDHIVSKIIPFLPKKIGRQISARIIPDLPDNKIKRYVLNEIKSLYKIKTGGNQEEILYKRNKRFQENISTSELKTSDIVIGYDTSSWLIARKCKELSIPFILDVSIGHPISKNIIFEGLYKKYPHWKNQVQIKNNKLIHYEKQENELASIIVAPSSFVKNSFIENGVESEKIKINPFGTNTSFFRFNQKKSDGKIKFLFFGGLTVRKGLPFLLNVWQQNNFQNAELTIAGFGELPKNFMLPCNVNNKGKVALDERVELFRTHDVFIFPSNFEGFAQVQIEATASGLPIISTPNAGGTEIVKHNFNGILINPESELELKQAIDFFINDPINVALMSKNQKEIIKDFTWLAYGDRWKLIIDDFLQN